MNGPNQTRQRPNFEPYSSLKSFNRLKNPKIILKLEKKDKDNNRNNHLVMDDN